jgi:hypothetical protein
MQGLTALQAWFSQFFYHFDYIDLIPTHIDFEKSLQTSSLQLTVLRCRTLIPPDWQAPSVSWPAIVLCDWRVWSNITDGSSLSVGAWRSMAITVLQDADFFSFSLRHGLDLSGAQISQAVAHLCNLRSMQISIYKRQRRRLRESYSARWCEKLFPDGGTDNQLSACDHVIDYYAERSALAVPSSSESWDVPTELVFEDQHPASTNNELHNEVRRQLAKRRLAKKETHHMGAEQRRKRQRISV